MILQSEDLNVATTFKGFLVSVQHPNGSLIGSFTVSSTEPANAGTRTACSGTSLSHSDSTAKTFVVFQWTAPADLDPNTDITVR